MSNPIIPDPVSPIVSPVVPYPGPVVPFDDVVPFTSRSGVTFAELFYGLRRHIDTVVIPGINKENDRVIQAWTDIANQWVDLVNEAISSQSADINSSLSEQLQNVTNALIQQSNNVDQAISDNEAYVNNAVQSIINSTIEVSDPVVVSLLDKGTNTRAKVDNIVDDRARWVTPEEFGAIGDGVTDDTSAFAAMCETEPHFVRLSPNKTYLISADTLSLPDASKLVGGSSGNYNSKSMSLVRDLGYSLILIKPIAGYDATIDPALSDPANLPDEPAHFGIKMGHNSIAKDFFVMPESFGDLKYLSANYPGAGNTTGIGSTTPTNNASVGIVMGAASLMENVITSGFYIGRFLRSQAKVMGGMDLIANIGCVASSDSAFGKQYTAMFCNSHGVFGDGNYITFTECRIEWNARYGISTGGESSGSNNVFDRNGWAGLHLRASTWGQAWTGNYFSRNGVGGDGLIGRWNFSHVDTESYVDTPIEKSCHVEIDYQRRVSITGNAFRAGRDDTSAGANGPAFVFSSTEVASGATPGSTVNIFGNAGITGDPVGYNTDMYGTGTGAIAGGTDNNLANALKKYILDLTGTVGITTRGPIISEDLIKANNGIGTAVNNSNNTTRQIPIIAGKSGMIVVKASNSGNAGLAVIYFSRREAYADVSATVVVIENKIGTPVSSAVMSANTQSYDVLTLTFDVSRWNSYNVIYAN